jgi:uncharacterized lipoprotein
MRVLKILLATIMVIAGCSSVFSGEQDTTVYDEDARVMSAAALNYPPQVITLRLHGAVVVSVTLGSHGEVVTATAVSGPPFLIPSCLASAKNWKFGPNPQKRAVIVFEFRFGEGTCPNGTYSVFRPPNILELVECEGVITG